MYPRRVFILAITSISIGMGQSTEDASARERQAFVASRQDHWAFRKPRRPEIPAIRDKWVRTPVDAFLLETMRSRNLTPSESVDQERLLRRVYLDVTGLPPTPGEADLFLRDRSPGAYEKLVDRLIASTHYGERWAQGWLELVGYADTYAPRGRTPLPQFWRYRDYVIRSFNLDKRWDWFLREQIAGDEFWFGDSDPLLALGFLRAAAERAGEAGDPETTRHRHVIGMTDLTASMFLGLSAGCARCHDHKFDPILQSDYHRLQAIFARTVRQDLDIATAQEKSAYEKEKRAYEQRLKPVLDKIDELEKPWRKRIRQQKLDRLDERYMQALKIPVSKRHAGERELAREAETLLNASAGDIAAIMNASDRMQRARLLNQKRQIESTAPGLAPTAFVMMSMDEGPASARVAASGNDPETSNETLVGDEVEPGFPAVLSGTETVPDGPSGRRAALASWLASPEHPLTARVMVNRIWQLRMGTGLVPAPGDFGARAGEPANRKLLDWLATEFVERKWSVKAIDRMILLSSTYRQTAYEDAAKSAVDPQNTLYWRAQERRLGPEIVRDCALAVADALNTVAGGKSDQPDRRRRSLYLLKTGTVTAPAASCTVRDQAPATAQPTELVSGDFMQTQSQAFAARLTRECGADRDWQVRRAFKLALARLPSATEMEKGRRLLAGGGLADLCAALLNSREFAHIP